MKDKYAGAAWNELMENETKESLAEMLLSSLDEIRQIRGEKEEKIRTKNHPSWESSKG